MKLPADVALLLERRFANQHRNWLGGAVDDGSWPLEIPLGAPTEAAAMKQAESVRAWAANWRAWRGPGELVWVERRWRTLGKQQLPSVLRLHGPEEVAASVGQQERWLRALTRYREMTERWPALQQRPGILFDMLADYSEADYGRLVATLAWLHANPRPGLYPRQLPVAGLDSKWIETRQFLLGDLVAALNGQRREGQDFFELCGLKRPPLLVRMRILDPELRANVGGLCDITASIDELSALDLPAHNVLVIENLQTGLAAQDLPGTVAIMALGYGVELLRGLPWVSRARCFYWGDIDTHGFAILRIARAAVPQLRSLLMDEETLLRHRTLWSSEPVQHGAVQFDLLTQAEALLYQQLKNHSFGANVRLEQERVEWAYAWPIIQGALSLVPSRSVEGCQTFDNR